MTSYRLDNMLAIFYLALLFLNHITYCKTILKEYNDILALKNNVIRNVVYCNYVENAVGLKSRAFFPN